MPSNSTYPQYMIAHGPLPARIIAGQPEPRWRVPERMARFNVPAVSAAVVDNMELCWAQAWGVLEQGQQAEATIDTLFQTASISKPVTAIGALCLVRQGMLSLDDEVSTVLQTWRLPRAGHTGQVTLRRLLSHSAGTSTPGFEGYGAGAPFPTLDQMLEGRRPANSPAVEVIVPPGTEFRYSGGGYLVVQKMKR